MNETLFRVLFLAVVIVIASILSAFVAIFIELVRERRKTLRAEEETRISSLPAPSFEDRLRLIDWFQFEKLVELAFLGSYRITRRGGANPDGGIDLILSDGAVEIAVQCKHWKTWNVGVKTVRELIGALQEYHIGRGAIIALRGGTTDARELGARHNIEIIDAREFSRLLATIPKDELQKALNPNSKTCPRCERPMVLRTARKGQYAGEEFWGCSGFPTCDYILPTTPQSRTATSLTL